MDELIGKRGVIDYYLQDVTGKSEDAQVLPLLLMSQGYILGARPGSLGKQNIEATQRVSSITGWSVLSFWPSGVGDSDGDFTLLNAAEDILAVVSYVEDKALARQVVLLGFDVMGAVFLSVASQLDVVGGVVAVGSDAGPKGLIEPSSLVTRLALSSVKTPVGYDLKTVENEVAKIEQEALGCLDKVPTLVVVTTERYRSRTADSIFGADSFSEVELHSFITDEVSLRYDPQLYAVLTGWLDRNF